MFTVTINSYSWNNHSGYSWVNTSTKEYESFNDMKEGMEEIQYSAFDLVKVGITYLGR